eukprot:gene2482-10011_t
MRLIAHRRAPTRMPAPPDRGIGYRTASGLLNREEVIEVFTALATGGRTVSFPNHPREVPTAVAWRAHDSIALSTAAARPGVSITRTGRTYWKRALGERPLKVGAAPAAS